MQASGDDVSNEQIRLHVLAAVSDNKLPALVSSVTNLLLDRTARVVWALTPDSLKGWSKQRALALSIASISGARLPSWADAERPGQRMHEFIGRYRERQKKLIHAEKAALRRAKAAGREEVAQRQAEKSRCSLEQEQYNCSYGCTPLSLPVRRVPPGMRAQAVEQIQTSIHEDNLQLRQENNALRRLETMAVEVLQGQLTVLQSELKNSVLTEHTSLNIVDSERQKREVVAASCLELSAEVAAMRKENQILNRQIKEKDKRTEEVSHVLGAKVARAHLDLVQAEQAGERKRLKLERDLTSREISVDVKERELAETLEQVKAIRKEKEAACRAYEAKVLRMGGHIARLSQELATVQARLQKAISKHTVECLRLQAKIDEQIAVVESMRRLKNKMAQEKRQALHRAATSSKRLDRAQEAERALLQLQVEYDEVCEAMESAADAAEHEMDASDEVQSTGRRDKRGRFEAEPAAMRVLKWAQLSRNVPTSAVNANITEVLRVYAPHAVVAQPCERQMRKMRGELTIAGEALAAFKIGKARRVVSFGFDETTKFGIALISTNVQIEPHNSPGTLVDVVPRGATVTAGGTAAKIAALVERKIFRHCRGLIDKWKETHEKRYGAGAWVDDGGPPADSVGLHRLCENTLIMSDTCSAAEATKKLLANMALEAAKGNIVQEAWDAMDERERAAMSKVWLGDCHQHLRNIIINAMAAGATEHLKEALSQDLAQFSSFDRMSVDGMDLIRAVFKELHSSGEYAKGKGREFGEWCAVNHRDFPLMPFERVAGSRQDLAFDGAVAIFWNRRVVIEFLHGLVHVPKADNKLEQFLACVLRCNEMTALLRVCTIFKFVFSEPMRWLAGKGSSLPDWSIVSANEVLDLAYQTLLDIASDGHVLFDPSLDPFAKIAAEQPAFKSWCQVERLARTLKSPDGQSHSVYKLALSEARSPTLGKGNAQATETAATLAEKMAQQGLVAMRDPRRAIREKLTALDSEFAFEKCKEMHEKTKGAHVTNDRVEKNFAIYDVVCRLFRNAPVENLSGISQQKTAHDFEMAPFIAHDRRHARNSGEVPTTPLDGYYWTVLNERQRESLVEMARLNAEEARSDSRKAMTEQNEERLARREERVIQLLNKTVEDYAYAKELFVQWSNQRATTAEQIERAIRGKPEVQQLEYLRLQIEMRVLGLGQTEYATRWSSSSDINIGTVAHLRDLLVKVILPEERQKDRKNELPQEASPPLSVPNALRKLGTTDLDAIDIEKKSLFSKDELEKKVHVAMARRIEAGITDDVERLQPLSPPPFDQDLVGKRLEVCWKYFVEGTGEPTLIWTSGTVKRVADGLTDRRSSKARAILPGGAVLWGWDEDTEFNEKAGEQWLVLLPSKWNPSKAVVYGWRFDARELQ